MEQVTLKVNQGVFSVEEIYLDADKENVFVFFVVINTIGVCDWSVGFTSVEDNDKIYTSIIHQQMKQAVLAHAMPILLNALQIKALQPDSAEDQASYQKALQELAKIEL
jgi:hypothetical protein